ncbi:MAG: assimilatory sulfite reductase (NADPH) flavoprotein subunit [Steroidobacteraceae bacterium]
MVAAAPHDNALPPADPAREGTLLALTTELTSGQIRYLAGFLAGIAAERDRIDSASARQSTPSSSPPPAAHGGAAARATVLFASQTGNGRRIAERLHRQLESQGLAARLVNVADYRPRELADERLLYLVASTHGDGDPPDDARGFIEHLTGRKAPALPRLAFSVLALGDSSYPKYCETGRLLDRRLAELGARRLAALSEADVDYRSVADAWADRAVADAREQMQAPHIAIISAPPPSQSATADRDTPVEVELLAATRITARQSERPVVHLELHAPAPQLAYEPGDAVGVWHRNPAFIVEQLAALVGTHPDTPVELDGATRTLGEWLGEHREITRLARPFVDAHAVRAANAELDRLRNAADGAGLRELLRDWQPLDLLQRFPADWSAAELLQALRPLTPRLYSIASSRAAVGDELHLTVAAVDYLHEGQRRVGAASHFLTQLAADPATRVRAYVEPNPRFRLPADAGRDIIMIGPGTGVAPFRGFLQQRIESGARGRNWLLFGGRHLHSDFLYQAEWLEARRKGALHRLDVAFSRDQQDKVYVQHRIREHGAELLRWLGDGAHVYVCGDAQRMAQDVHAALRDVLVTHGGRDADDAEAELAALAAERRYARDVY